MNKTMRDFTFKPKNDVENLIFAKKSETILEGPSQIAHNR